MKPARTAEKRAAVSAHEKRPLAFKDLDGNIAIFAVAAVDGDDMNTVDLPLYFDPEFRKRRTVGIEIFHHPRGKIDLVGHIFFVSALSFIRKREGNVRLAVALCKDGAFSVDVKIAELGKGPIGKSLVGTEFIAVIGHSLDLLKGVSLKRNVACHNGAGSICPRDRETRGGVVNIVFRKHDRFVKSVSSFCKANAHVHGFFVGKKRFCIAHGGVERTERSVFADRRIASFLCIDGDDSLFHF